jgi:hypothetical protein
MVSPDARRGLSSAAIPSRGRFMPGGPIFPMNLPSAMVTNIHGDWVSELGLSMSTLQKRSSAALETCLLILFRNASDLELQLHEIEIAVSGLGSGTIGPEIAAHRQRNKRTLRQGPRQHCSLRPVPAALEITADRPKKEHSSRTERQPAASFVRSPSPARARHLGTSRLAPGARASLARSWRSRCFTSGVGVRADMAGRFGRFAFCEGFRMPAA